MELILKLIVVVVVLVFGAQQLPGVYVRDWPAATAAAIVFGVLAVLIGWLLEFTIAVITLPLSILTLGAFALLIGWIVNAILLRMAAGLLANFDVRDWPSAFALSALYSVALFVVQALAR